MSTPSQNDAEAAVIPFEERRTATVAGSGAAGGIPVTDSVQAHESELISRTIQGDSESFYDLVRPYERSVFLTALSLVKQPADAEDVAQDAILKAFKNLSRFRQESKFSTWLTQITLNEAKMRLRKDRKHLYESLNDDQWEDRGNYIPRDFADWRPIPSEALEQTEVREALNKALQSLPAKYRSVLFFRDVQQFSIKETADLLGLTITTVKTRLSRARLRLRDALAPGFDGSWRSGGALPVTKCTAALKSRLATSFAPEDSMTKYQYATVDGKRIFYRAAGLKIAPTILLLHGFPTSPHMFNDLIPALADSHHLVAPDLPGFGFSDAPDNKR